MFIFFEEITLVNINKKIIFKKRTAQKKQTFYLCNKFIFSFL